MKLELKHLAPYLPYSLMIKTKHGWDTMSTLNELNVNVDFEDSYSYEDHPNEILEFKPILRPLSDYYKWKDVMDEFSINSENEFKEAFFGFLSDARVDKFDSVNYTVVTKLLENHFDLFGLIDAGLAIDINTLND
jgi:hypothetical protein